jgi:hypothetical protein
MYRNHQVHEARRYITERSVDPVEFAKRKARQQQQRAIQQQQHHQR